jgi:hypothetical protein
VYVVLRNGILKMLSNLTLKRYFVLILKTKLTQTKNNKNGDLNAKYKELISLNPHTNSRLYLSWIFFTCIIQARNDCQSHDDLNMKLLKLKGNNNLFQLHINHPTNIYL